MNKKYFFFDIDGTLTDKSTGKIVPSAQVALNELQKKGHFVAIATGRAHYKARKFMEGNCQPSTIFRIWCFICARRFD